MNQQESYNTTRHHLREWLKTNERRSPFENVRIVSGRLYRLLKAIDFDLMTALTSAQEAALESKRPAFVLLRVKPEKLQIEAWYERPPQQPGMDHQAEHPAGPDHQGLPLSDPEKPDNSKG